MSSRSFGRPAAGAAALLILALLLTPVQASPEPNATGRTAALVYLHGAARADATAILGRAPVEDYGEFLLVRADRREAAALEAAGMDVEVIDVDTIHAGYRTFSVRRPATPPPDLAGWGNMYLVQFIGPIKSEWVERIAALGAEVCDYVPNFAFVARMDAAACARVAAWDRVKWVGPYHAAYRIDPEIAAGDDAGTFEVRLFPGFAAADVAAAVADLGLGAAFHADSLLLEGTGSDARALAHVDGVAWIGRFNEPQLMNAAARGVIKADVAHDRGLSGAGGATRQVVGLTDAAVDASHEAFSRTGKLSGEVTFGFGRGTHPAGSVLGDAPDYDTWNQYDGQGHGANGFVVVVFDEHGNWIPEEDYYSIWQSAYTNGARINNNSWGSASGGAYSLSDTHADDIQWDYRGYLLLAAAGNSGDIGANTVGSPGVAKNVITVGASETDSPENLAFFSSRGPTDDGRIKPDVCAPGHPIFSAQGGTTFGYVSKSGTSTATAVTSGAAVLVRDYYMRGFYPSGAANSADAFTPSAALMKATLIGGAEEMTGTYSDRNGEGVYPNNSQGWGRINLDNSLYFSGDARLMKVWDSPQNLGTGSSWSSIYSLDTATDRAVKVTLAWTDYFGSGLKNNLDLEVIAPDGTIFKGNNFTGLDPGYSVADGTFDTVNNVEGVHLLPGKSYASHLPTGTYTIRVYGTNIPYYYSNFAVVITEFDHQADPVDEQIALMGDYNGQIHDLLTTAGFSVRSYSGGDFETVIRNLGAHQVVVMHAIMGCPGDLLQAAATLQRGLVFLSSYPVTSHAMGLLYACYGDPAVAAGNWLGGPVKLKVEAFHPVFGGYSLGQVVTIIDGGDNDYQSYDGWSGTNIGSSQMPSGHPWFIGIKDRGQTGGSKQVIMGSFGANMYTNVTHWTADGKQIFQNAVVWAMVP